MKQEKTKTRRKNKASFCGQCYEAYVSQMVLNTVCSSQGSWALSQIQLQRHSSQKTRLGPLSPLHCAALGHAAFIFHLDSYSSWKCCLHCVFCVSPISSFPPLDQYPLTAPREVLLGRVPFVLREVEGLLTGLQSLQGCKRIQGYKGVGSFLPRLGPSGWLSLVFMETSGVLAFTILLTQKPSSTRIVLY